MHPTGCKKQHRAQRIQIMFGMRTFFLTIGALFILIQPLGAGALVLDAAQPLTRSDAEATKKRASQALEVTKPEWSELTSSQKMALLPLRENWRALGETSKRKWIALSNNFQKMTPAEQVKLHTRMNEWVALSQQQRMEARLNFAQSKLLPKSQKSATWEAYQALSHEDKKRLARVEKEKKSTPTAGLKNKQTPKLMTVPVKNLTRQLQPTHASAHLILDRHTLLLRSQEIEESSSKN